MGLHQNNLIFTKEIAGRFHEGTTKVHHSLNLDVGHTSHFFINDELNYRVELNQPMIVFFDELREEDVLDVMALLKDKKSDILFVSKRVSQEISSTVASLRWNASYSVMNLSETNLDIDLLYDSLISHLQSVQNPPSEKYIFKTVKRVLMEGDKSYLLDPFFENFIGSKEYLNFEELVEVHLRSPNEAWIHTFMHEINDAHQNVRESFQSGILPEWKTSFYLANQELKSYYSENSDIQSGMEMVQKAIDSVILENRQDLSSHKTLFKDYLDRSIVDGTFIPATKPAKIVSDIVTICNYLF